MTNIFVSVLIKQPQDIFDLFFKKNKCNKCPDTASNFQLIIYLRGFGIGNHNLNKCGFGFRFNNFPNVIAHPYEKLVHSSVAVSKINY